jgi:DNA-binding NarL/FixJ family response regulator
LILNDPLITIIRVRFAAPSAHLMSRSSYLSFGTGVFNPSLHYYLVKTARRALIFDCGAAMKRMTKRNNGITGREREVLQRLKSGGTSREIASMLDISERTVKFHISNIMKKLKAENRTRTVVIAMEKGLIN